MTTFLEDLRDFTRPRASEAAAPNIMKPCMDEQKEPVRPTNSNS
eukprot:CAMPEP_0169117312 /NCGR_PEP_ID=MMETSP1015-20121227/30387_1 /TAXON_ID=342587 /ORGANISM="Karlodinium micrum, Strain CCMP2283" /LENGTH=43 /DNA_ID= /DNA_START= /DNA_END= /DNA_ORIENTATION=